VEVADVDVVVVGAGVMGAATARSLARAGREVALLEQFELGHARGSSHGRSRIFRFSYHDPMYVRMAQEALPLWRELEAETGDTILRTIGGLDLGPAVDGHARALRACGAAFELLRSEEAAERFPVLRLPRDVRTLFQPDAGVIRADRAVSAFVHSATKHGAQVRERCRVLGLAARGDRAEVRTATETFRGRVAVVTAGAWARELLSGAGIDILTRPTRETVAYFRLDDDRLPTLVEWGPPAGYALPSPGQGIKAGEHGAGPEIDPDSESSGPSQASVGRLRAWVSERFPSAEPDPHHVETCLYTNTPDESFILERRGPIVIGSPCSGHGFKFAPWIGDRLARLAVSGTNRA
jgi:sarcosine oxidase